jgi:predicted class III extradiol MEMO1 family dioxygenase
VSEAARTQQCLNLTSLLQPAELSFQKEHSINAMFVLISKYIQERIIRKVLINVVNQFVQHREYLILNFLVYELLKLA